MAEIEADDTKPRKTKPSSTLLVSTGLVATTFAAIFTGRMVWEETFLTMQQGPQMLGFSLAHGAGAILFLGPIILLLWILAALIVLVVGLFRKRPFSKPCWLTLGSAIAVIGILSIPPAFYQWLLIRNFARSSHASDLMVYDAGEGDLRTVRGFLEHGVPLTATNYEGATATFAAAAEGSLPVVEMLVERGADLNATNLYGDSPLEAATENGHTPVVVFLKAHGALQIRGTPEQREAASEMIVRKEIERERMR
jgi:hypothetical protein